MKKILLLFTLTIYASLEVGFGQYIDSGGEWRSSTGNNFLVWVTSSGICYKNLNSGQIMNARTVGPNRYQADFYTDNILMESIILTVINGNTIEAFKPNNQQSQNWTRKDRVPQIFVCGVSSDIFNFFYSEQQNSNWCWAACIQMILNYYSVNISQSQIVLRTFGTDNLGNVGNWGGSIENIHRNLNDWNIDNLGKRFVVKATFYNGAPQVEWLINELNSSRPVFIAYNTGSGGHAVLITACTYTKINEQYKVHSLTVRDPWPGRGKVLYNGYDLASKIDAHWFVRVSKH